MRDIGGKTGVVGVVPSLILTGLAAGFANGLLGAGGGIIIVFSLSRILAREEGDGNEAFAHALCVMLPLSFLSCMIYLMRGNMSTEGFGLFVLPAVAGGLIGGALLGKLRSTFMRKLFSLLVIVSGILLMVR